MYVPQMQTTNLILAGLCQLSLYPGLPSVTAAGLLPSAMGCNALYTLISIRVSTHLFGQLQVHEAFGDLTAKTDIDN